MGRHLMYAALLVLTIIFGCHGDISLHNPRGNNDRLNEKTRDRKNANRLFNSQNNARGGYNVGIKPMYYYAGSKLEIQWAVQHTCGDENNNCEVVIQYMCSPHIKPGKRTTTPPVGRGSCRGNNCHENGVYGINEDFHHYEKCASRERNGGLYTADQKLGKTSRSTRQNAGGTRYGYECPEERDYYPYWGPSPWKDIVVFTNDDRRCDYYRRESQNVKGRYECIIDNPNYWNLRGSSRVVLFQTKAKCEASVTTVGGVKYRGKWVLVNPHGISAPECRRSPWSRDNHQGNTIGGQFMKYDWTIPKLKNKEETCVLRIRYNISTNDFKPWDTFSPDNEVVTVTRKQPQTMRPANIWNVFGMNINDARQRQFYLRNNPNVDIFKKNMKNGNRFRLRLAINTAQFGRTFQDRTHPFKIKHRPTALNGKVIYNINVRGKRGNLQQVFPATEYDFVPNKLNMYPEEMVHFQWTGTNTNPNNNAGNGKAGTDRSNIVPLIERKFPIGYLPWSETSNLTMRTNYPLKSLNLLGFSKSLTNDLAFLQKGKGKKDPELNGKSPYFDLGPQKVDKRGTYYYMCTRNNQFTNRNQKAAIFVGEEYQLDGYNSYRGHKSTTVSGLECQRWDSQYPHEHAFTPDQYPDEGLEDNYCRNPRTDEFEPWCFTTNSMTLWEYCDVKDEAERKREKENSDAEMLLKEAISLLSAEDGNSDELFIK